MTKRLVLAVAILGLVAFVAPPAIAGGHEEEGDEGKISFHFMSRIRYENLNNYFDYEDHDDGVGNDRMAFWPYRNMFGFKAKLANNVWAKMDLQNVGSLGNQHPQLSTAYPEYQNFDGDGFPAGVRSSDTYLYRAVVGMSEIGGTGLGVAVGRNELNLGTGLILGNEPFYNGIVFDGIVGWYKFDKWERFGLKVKGLYLNTAERNDPAAIPTIINNFSLDPEFGVEDEKLWGGVGSIWFGSDDMQQMVDVYILNVNDGYRYGDHPNFFTYGVHYRRDIKTADQAKAFGLNWNFELALQSGEQDGPVPDEDIDIGGMILEAEAGWTFAVDSIMHGPMVGVFMTSGDDDLTDDSEDGWIPLFPTEHGRLGAADYFGQGFYRMDSAMTAFNIGYWVKAGEGKHKAYAKYWMFKPTEDEIDDGGLTPLEVEDYGKEIDLGYAYKYSPNLHLFASIAQLMPDDGLTDPLAVGGQPDDPVTRLYGGVYLKFH